MGARSWRRRPNCSWEAPGKAPWLVTILAGSVAGVIIVLINSAIWFPRPPSKKGAWLMKGAGEGAIIGAVTPCSLLAPASFSFLPPLMLSSISGLWSPRPHSFSSYLQLPIFQNQQSPLRSPTCISRQSLSLQIPVLLNSAQQLVGWTKGQFFALHCPRSNLKHFLF